MTKPHEAPVLPSDGSCLIDGFGFGDEIPDGNKQHRSRGNGEKHAYDVFGYIAEIRADIGAESGWNSGEDCDADSLPSGYAALAQGQRHRNSLGHVMDHNRQQKRQADRMGSAEAHCQWPGPRKIVQGDPDRDKYPGAHKLKRAAARARSGFFSENFSLLCSSMDSSIPVITPSRTIHTEVSSIALGMRLNTETPTINPAENSSRKPMSLSVCFRINTAITPPSAVPNTPQNMP